MFFGNDSAGLVEFLTVSSASAPLYLESPGLIDWFLRYARRLGRPVVLSSLYLSSAGCGSCSGKNIKFDAPSCGGFKQPVFLEDPVCSSGFQVYIAFVLNNELAGLFSKDCIIS